LAFAMMHYEFTFQRGDDLETITGTAGTSVAILPNVPHTFRNASSSATGAT
jgi:quercetin dioxygenase-like cupin family protein